MIDCPICGAENFEYEDYCVECDYSLDPDNYEEDPYSVDDKTGSQMGDF